MNRPLILPPLRRTPADAARLARAVHGDQLDKADRPYVDHLLRVARGTAREMVRGAGFDLEAVEVSEAVQIAWLHDTIEDTWVSEETLSREGFSPPVVKAVSLLTKSDRPVPYQIQIERLVDLADISTILVKLADVEDNSDPDRLALLPAETRERLLKKYEPAKEVLRAAARKKGWQG